MSFTDAELLPLLPVLKSFAFKWTGDLHLAEDLSSDAIVKALRHRGKFKEGTNLKNWTLMIMRNHFISQVRRNRFVGETYEGAELDLPANSNLDAHIELKEVMEIIGFLSKSQRESLLLIAGGESYEDVAIQLNMELGTVKSSVARARAILHTYFD